ncbi:hypothetical protein BDV93DRAFT_399597, partial [Ceratobasidium sp. AG-I]
QHRAIMAPLTLYRTDGRLVHVNVAFQYHCQHAEVSGILLITEVKFIAGETGG